MGVYDRDYYYTPPASSPNFRLSATGALLAANLVVFLLTFGTEFGRRMASLGVMQPEAVLHGEAWRVLTATYLHASFWGHLFFNMLALFFLGPPLERVWGARRFLVVYTVAGVAGNVVLALLSQVGYISPLMVGLGASGSVLGVLGAAAVMFPDSQILLFFVLPVSLRQAALIFVAVYVFNLLAQGANYGGDVCHLVGLAVGALSAAFGRGPHLMAGVRRR
jgi:membrane associated rhomboid family serine protease